MKGFLILSAAVLVVLLPIFGIDVFNRRVVFAEIDKAYLCVDSHPEAALATLKSSAKTIRDRLGRITMLPKRAPNMALSLIEKQLVSLDVTIRLSSGHGDSEYGREISKRYLDEYEKSVPTFKQNIEYIRQSF